MGSKLDKVVAGASPEGKLKAENAELRKAVAHRDSVITAQQERIEALCGKRYTLKPGQSRPRKGTYVRMIIADTHGCFANNQTLKAILRDVESIAPREIVLLGDHLDCAGWLSRHHPFKTIQEARYSFEDDCDAANAFLDAIQKAAPGAKLYQLEGNHEERIEAFVVESTQGHHKDASYMRKLFSPEVVMNLAQRGIEYFRRTERYGNLRVRGCLKLGHCHFVHGVSHAKHAAAQHLAKLKANVVFGHTHRPQQASTADTETEMHAWCPGCACEFEPMWKHSQPTEWGHGVGIQLVRPDSGFLHLNVPIINGVSYLGPLLEVAK